MGWRAFTRDGEELVEGTHGRPVAAGEEGKLLGIAQEDYGRTVFVDLVNGVIVLDYESLVFDAGILQVIRPKVSFVICDDTTIVGELMHWEQKFVPYRDEEGRKVIDSTTGKFVNVRNDVLTPLVWRPIWFTRYTNGIPTKIIGAQTTMPKEHGGKNAKKMIMIFEDGRIGID